MKNLNSIRKSVFTVASKIYHQLKKSISWGKAISLAWSRLKLSYQLREGVARFSFTKKDGSIRAAIGTLREGNFTYQSKGSTRRKNPLILSYFDLEKNSFRSCNILNLIA